jgi:thiol:disulfide interchange protein DsbD
LKINKKAPSGNLSISGRLSYQACALKFCMPPEDVPVPVNLSIVPAETAVKHLNKEMFKPEEGPSTSDRQFHGFGVGAGFWLTLVGLFIGGMALNLTPCIYPLIPITVSYFGGMSNRIRGRTIIHGLLYISGLAITNSLLGLTASLTGSMLGVFLQNPIVLILVSGFLFFLALSFFELWELQLPSGLTRLASKNFGGYFGTFFMGLTLGIVAAPCLGPFMLGLLTYVAKMGEPFLGFGGFRAGRDKVKMRSPKARAFNYFGISAEQYLGAGFDLGDADARRAIQLAVRESAAIRIAHERLIEQVDFLANGF